MYTVKRPLAVIGFTFFITSSVMLSLPAEYFAVLLAVFALFVFIHFKTRKVFTKYLLLMLVTAFAAAVYVNAFSYFYQNSVDKISTDTKTYTGYIKEINNPDGTSYIVSLLNEKHREIYNVSVYYSSGFELGDIVEITGKFKPAKRDKYIFSNYSQNVKGSITADKIIRTDKNVKTVKYNALAIKNKLLNSAEQLFDNEYFAIVSAVAYGDSHRITPEIKSLFKTAGLSHALVVSGLHIGIIMLAIQSLFRYIPIYKKIKNVITAIAVIIFMYIVGLSPSVIRAGFIAAAVLLSRNFNKEQDSFTTLALVGLLSIIANPYITRNVGAMLSYSACTGLILANSWCDRNKIKETKKDFICASAAVIFTIPVLSMAGMYVTLMSPVYNLLLAVFVMVICVVSVFAPIINLIPIIRLICPFLVMTNKFCIDALLNALSFIKQYMDFTTVNLKSPLWSTVIFSVLASCFVAFFQFEKRRNKNIFIIFVSISAFVCYNLLNCNIVAVTAFDSGREGSFHISANDNEYLVLTEDITAEDAEDIMVSPLNKGYKSVYYCPKEFKIDVDMSKVAENTMEIKESGVFVTEDFILHADIDGSKKLFTISVNECDISFGHGKVKSTGSEYYFLGNDKPKEITANEIYIFGNTPSWMEVENINNINSDIKIKINTRTGKYKTVKDVFNFGCRI
ncbi:MAG: ComEC family competence protein [Ruminococcaceae bacterium]|nr:ComEC family competence protein [Oscillospiraceae bacterium]